MLFNLALPKTVDDYIADYERCKSGIDDVYKCSERLSRISNEAGLRFGNHRPHGYQKQAHSELLQSAWRRIIDASGISRFMDSEALKEFESSLTSKPPAFTRETIRATLIQCQSEAEMMFNRGVYNLFARLSDNYKSNTKSAFRLSNRVVFSGLSGMSWGRSGGRQVNHYQSDMLNDLHRCICVLLEQPYIVRGLEIQVNEAWKDSQPFENNYLQFKAYKNGNAHLHIKSAILLERINACIANYCGAQLPEAA